MGRFVRSRQVRMVWDKRENNRAKRQKKKKIKVKMDFDNKSNSELIHIKRPTESP